jgi:hypothetical protein
MVAPAIALLFDVTVPEMLLVVTCAFIQNGMKNTIMKGINLFKLMIKG